ncbi:gamma-glutamyltransferase [Acuticoccus sediminis]|uniref:Gamma-glutamyltransferase n=1 Tax=Acuticoccus sediminis TaxID=2184697 RepID=A0A8B2NQJ8_9HYPH|nr:gamma-glutamyltransferase family protein [Acuticoccus sediminis]RAH99291.1 gamma-glutamyltransferase [Acuticoccus sediminis]
MTPPFTTRPDIRGTFGVVTSTHWIASAVGFGVLERGGNAFDAAVATGFALQIVEPHLNGPGGELPVLFHEAASGRTAVLCAQGIVPQAATIARFRELGLDMVPGSGLLPTVVPGSFDGWMLLLREYGTITVREALAAAIDLARDGHPVMPRVANTLAGLADFFATDWPTSGATWMPDGTAPAAHELLANPETAAMYARIVEEAERAGPDRVAQIEAARTAWREGFVADTMFAYLDTASVPDMTGRSHGALLTRDDVAQWRATIESPVSGTYHGWTVHKTAPWSQGPVLLQALAILEHIDIAGMDPDGAVFVHTVTEAIKLAFADRETFYGDPAFCEVPLARLLDPEHNRARAALIAETASLEQRPSRLPGFEHLADAFVERAARDSAPDISPLEPTMAHLTERRGDTVHLDVIDRWGNVVSATPSGGWFQSSPSIPGLGFSLNTRAQMFWLEEGLPTSLMPGARPRTTLTPTIAEKDGIRLALGTPGGDQQDQWQLIAFLRHVHHGMSLQANLDAPLFHSMHVQGSFYPRAAKAGELTLEASFGAEVIDELTRRGHRVTVVDEWSVGRLTAAERRADGRLCAAASPRLMQAYAVGR